MDEFLEACGASGPLRLAVEEAHPSASGAGAGARVLEQPFAVIGRDPRCDVVLDHPEVSPRHVYLQIVNGRLLFIDLGSRSGVSHAGKRRKVGWLARDEALRIGPYRVRLHGGDSARGDAPSLPAADAPMAFEDGRVLDAMAAAELSHRAVRSSRVAKRLLGAVADRQRRRLPRAAGRSERDHVSRRPAPRARRRVGCGPARRGGHPPRRPGRPRREARRGRRDPAWPFRDARGWDGPCPHRDCARNRASSPIGPGRRFCVRQPARGVGER